MSTISVSNLKKYYGKIKAVDDISFEITEGERFGFLGPNGAGKTTTIRSILGLLKITGGSITILGKKVRSLKDIDYREKIGYLPGELGLPNDKTAQEILNYLSHLYINSIDWAHIKELSLRLKLPLNRKTGELSKGNKQKIGIIAALMKPFPLLILDEPTSGLDPLMQLEFFQILKEHQLKNHSTVLLCSHLLPEVEKFCDKVAIIRQGKIVEISRIQDLKQKNLKQIEVEFESIKGSQDFRAFILQYPNIVVKDQISQILQILVPFQQMREILHIITEKQFDGSYIKDISLTNSSLENIFLQYY